MARREGARRSGIAQDYHHGALRAALLTAGEAELTERGVEGFSLRGAAARAGVSHAAPAHHFGDADGLLTALAAEGFARFAAAMRRRQAEAAADGRAPIDAAGLGYVDFACANPALFRLMFSSSRPDFEDPALAAAAEAAFGLLVQGVAGARGADPWGDPDGPVDVAAAWALAHGVADLLLSGRLPFLKVDLQADADATVLAILARMRIAEPSGA